MTRKPCSVDGCSRPSQGRGLCKMHWARQRRTGQTGRMCEMRERWEPRFWAKVDRASGNGCWTWNAATSRGYGLFSRGGRSGRMELAHRVSWEIAHGEPPSPDRLVRHRCDNPPCVNPAHLELGDQHDNMRDMAVRGRSGRAKLSVDDVLSIRFLAAAGMSRRELAGRFGVAPSNVSAIVRRETWKHVPAADVSNYFQPEAIKTIAETRLT